MNNRTLPLVIGLYYIVDPVGPSFSQLCKTTPHDLRDLKDRASKESKDTELNSNVEEEKQN